MPGPYYFAWVGDALEEQITLVTNGTTHGARPERATVVGDTVGGQLQNVVSNKGLEVGALYAIEGSGIAADTFFLFDDSILAGLPDSINLSNTTTSAVRSATYSVSKCDVVGSIAGTLSQGSNTVNLSGVTLPAGLYGITGTGIGETDVPVGTTTGTTYLTGGGIMTVSSAYMEYDGGGTGHMMILAATPHTTLAFDMFGQETSVTTYSIAPQPVRATASGTFGFLVTGFPAGDAFVVDGIPSAALMGLTPGHLYNITGNGIAPGSTFIAPASGATAVTLDLATTTSEINAILTITGPRTPDAPFDPAVHNRFDEDILSIEISQDEGGFATLAVEVKNPGLGLLAIGRQLWAWLSWDQAWAPGGSATPDLVPLFNGRLVGVPRLQANEVVRLEFIARPNDLSAQKQALAANLAVLPYYDPIWLAQNINPDTVLETYSALYQTDRVSLALSVSDILEGEDGTIDVGEDASLYDHFSLSYGQPPLVATMVSGTVTWTQEAEGSIDVTELIVQAFGRAGSGYKHSFAKDPHGGGGGGLIQCMCGDGLKSDWPRPGTTIGGGWSLSTINDHSGYPLCYILDATSTTQGGWLQPTFYAVNYSGQGLPPTGTPTHSSIILRPYDQLTVSFPINVYKIRMTLNYRANRTRTETVTAVVAAGVQPELSDSTENDREAISLTSQYVGEAVDPDGAIPIGSPARRSYFQTARGAASFEYLLLAARAKMRARARSVDITFAVDWRTALGIGLRHSVRYFDRRVPGGVATGKVKHYRLTAGTAGMLGEFTIGCTIGTDDAISPQAGVPSYVDTGYVNPGYQTMPGAQVPIAGGEVAYEALDSFVIVDDGLDLTNLTADKAVNECIVTNGMSVQMPALAAFQNTVVTGGTPVHTMNTLTTRVTLDLKPVAGGEFHTGFFPAVTPLMLPKTIDLSATAPGAR